MRWLLVVAIVVATYGTARAQVVPAPMVAEPKMTAGVSATVWLPQGDADDFADTSIGLRPHFAYDAKPFLSVLGTFDYIFVSEKDGVGDLTYYNICVGARLKKPRPGQIEPYGELLLGWHKLEADGGIDDSGIGFRLGGGVLYPISATLIANVALNYSAVSIDVGLGDADIDALIFEGGLGIRF